jgi:EAL domain-containing protein (putative c-di-GMP-specific phosphodiesterase class I)
MQAEMHSPLTPAVTELVEQSVHPHAPGVPDARTPEVLRDALRAMRSHFGMEVAFLSEFHDDHRVLRYVDATEPLRAQLQGRSDALADTYCQRIVDGRLPAVLPDAAHDPEAARLAATRLLPVGAHLGVPIRFRSGELYGTLCCFGTRPDPTLRPRDVQTMQLFADLLAPLIEEEVLSGRAQQERRERIGALLEEGRFSMAYQPIFHLAQQRVVGYEALARFHAEPVQGPDRWFAEAAAVGLQPALERAAIERALQDLERVPAGQWLSLNVSPATLVAPGFAGVFGRAPLARLVLELTEHASIEDYDVVARVLQPLRAAGLRLAVDDAGAGFASFRHILQLRPDLIKLDASLIHGIDARTESRALAAALIRFAAETRCLLIAEGVETEGELAVLRRLGVDKAQGYLLGRPAPWPAAAAST